MCPLESGYLDASAFCPSTQPRLRFIIVETTSTGGSRPTNIMNHDERDVRLVSIEHCESKELIESLVDSGTISVHTYVRVRFTHVICLNLKWLLFCF